MLCSTLSAQMDIIIADPLLPVFQYEHSVDLGAPPQPNRTITICTAFSNASATLYSIFVGYAILIF